MGGAGGLRWFVAPVEEPDEPDVEPDEEPDEELLLMVKPLKPLKAETVAL